MATPDVEGQSSSSDLRPVSPALAKVRLLALAVTMLPVLGAVVVVGLLTHAPLWIVLGALVLWIVATAWFAVVLVRQVSAMGYAFRDHDLLIERGILLRRSTLVPYGRMQFVEVTRGPLARRFGLATVQLHTAASASDATIDGLPQQEAEQLRDALAARGESDLAGL